ncbi:MAG: YggT family protein [Bacillota bacterium]
MISYVLFRTFNLFVSVFFYLIIARAILSWIRPQGYHRWYYTINDALYRATEPILAPIRRLLPQRGMIDWTPLVAIILLEVLRSLAWSLYVYFL